MPGVTTYPVAFTLSALVEFLHLIYNVSLKAPINKDWPLAN